MNLRDFITGIAGMAMLGNLLYGAIAGFVLEVEPLERNRWIAAGIGAVIGLVMLLVSRRSHKRKADRMSEDRVVAVADRCTMTITALGRREERVQVIDRILAAVCSQCGERKEAGHHVCAQVPSARKDIGQEAV